MVRDSSRYWRVGKLSYKGEIDENGWLINPEEQTAAHQHQ